MHHNNSPPYSALSLKLLPLPCAVVLVLQRLRLARPTTTSYSKTCTKHLPVLVLQSLHTVHPISTLCFEACRNYFPVLLRTTKFAQSTFQHYFGLQSLHKALPSTTSDYKVRTALPSTISYFLLQSLHRGREGARGQPVLLRISKFAQIFPSTTKFAQSVSLLVHLCSLSSNFICLLDSRDEFG